MHPVRPLQEIFLYSLYAYAMKQLLIFQRVVVYIFSRKRGVCGYRPLLWWQEGRYLLIQSRAVKARTHRVNNVSEQCANTGCSFSVYVFAIGRATIGKLFSFSVYVFAIRRATFGQLFAYVRSRNGTSKGMCANSWRHWLLYGRFCHKFRSTVVARKWQQDRHRD
jgi:hypothetical protein